MEMVVVLVVLALLAVGVLVWAIAIYNGLVRLRNLVQEAWRQIDAELTNTEDRIAAGRRFSNANVRQPNTRLETFPPNVVANMFSFRRAGYFEANDPAVRAVPSVHLTAGEAPGSAAPVDGGPSFGGQGRGYDPRRDA